MHKALYLIDGVDPEKLEAAKAEIRVLGAPTIRVVDCGDHYMAIEGVHRLAAAAELGVAPNLAILKQDDKVEPDSLDKDYFQTGEIHTAGEIAEKLHAMRNSVLTIEPNGTLRW